MIINNNYGKKNCVFAEGVRLFKRNLYTRNNKAQPNIKISVDSYYNISNCIFFYSRNKFVCVILPITIQISSGEFVAKIGGELLPTDDEGDVDGVGRGARVLAEDDHLPGTHGPRGPRSVRVLGPKVLATCHCHT